MNIRKLNEEVSSVLDKKVSNELSYKKKGNYKILCTCDSIRKFTEDANGTIIEFKDMPGEQFGIRKEGKVYTATHVRSGLAVISDSKFSDLVDRLADILSNPELLKQIKEVKSLDDEVIANKKEVEKLESLMKEFKELTGIELKVDRFIGGVDVIDLDKKMDTPDGISLSDYIKEKFGQRASDIIDELV